MSLSKRQSDFKIKQLNYSDIFQIFDEGVIIYEKGGKIVFYNNAQSKIDGISQFEAIGKSMYELYHINSLENPMLRCINTQKPVIGSTSQYRTRSGKQINANRNIYPLYDEKEFVGVICFIREYSRIASNVKQAQSKSPLQTNKKGPKVSFRDIIGKNSLFMQSVQTAIHATKSTSAVMLVGESGTGKELFAQSIHNHGQWKNKSFTVINCSAIPENLLEGILFGTSQSAFTGAMEKSGLFEQANGGTLFLDEINSMPIGLQAKMLRVIQERKVRRVGSLEEIEIDLKIISSVNENPEKAIEANRLRQDLFYRLGVVLVNIPPLRDRLDDLSLLTPYFIKRCNQKLNKNVKKIDDEVADMFMHYRWPGNVRELEHVIEGTMNMISIESTITKHLLPDHFTKHFPNTEIKTMPSVGETISISNLKEIEDAGSNSIKPYSIDYNSQNLKDTLTEVENHIIQEMIRLCNGNAAKAAKNLGISRQLIYLKMKKLGIEPHNP